MIEVIASVKILMICTSNIEDNRYSNKANLVFL